MTSIAEQPLIVTDINERGGAAWVTAGAQNTHNTHTHTHVITFSSKVQGQVCMKKGEGEVDSKSIYLFTVSFLIKPLACRH